jgi:hypothetical protein
MFREGRRRVRLGAKEMALAAAAQYKTFGRNVQQNPNELLVHSRQIGK